jgi:hypothetical protein
MKTLFITIIVAICLLSSGISRADWVQTNGPLGGDVYALASTGNYIFAAIGTGVYRSTDDGLNWTQSIFVN